MATATTDRPVAATTFPVARADLAAALRAAGTVRSKAIHLDIAEGLAVSSYSPDVAVTRWLELDTADIFESVAVDRARLAALLPYCGPEIKLGIADKTLVLESDDSRFELTTFREGGPEAGRHGHVEFDAISPDQEATIEAATLVEVLRRTLPFTSTDMTRPVLCNIALYPDDHVAAATDAYRLAVVRYGDGVKAPRATPFAIFRDGATSIGRLLKKKLGPVELRQSKTHVGVSFGGITWSMRRYVVDTEKHGRSFPDWPTLIACEDADVIATVKVDREDLLGACRAASALTKHGAPLRVTLDDAGAQVELRAPDIGHMTRRLSSADSEGEQFEMGLNAKFVADMCAQAPVERLTARFRGPLRPVLFEAARDQYLIMPIRLNV